MNKYTLLETSKQLNEWGCEIESENVWANVPYNYEVINEKGTKWEIISRNVFLSRGDICEYYSTYDLLWDICIKYSKGFKDKNDRYKILDLLEEGKNNEAEKIILEKWDFKNV